MIFLDLDVSLNFKNGNLIEHGDHKKLMMNKSYYSDLYKKQKAEQTK